MLLHPQSPASGRNVLVRVSDFLSRWNSVLLRSQGSRNNLLAISGLHELLGEHAAQGADSPCSLRRHGQRLRNPGTSDNQVYWLAVGRCLLTLLRGRTKGEDSEHGPG